MDIFTEDNEAVMTMINSLSACAVICSYDAYHTLEAASTPFFRLTGYTVPDLEERFQNRLKEMIHPEDRPVISEIMESQLRGSGFFAFGCRIACRDGGFQEIEFHGGLFYGQGGERKLFGIIEACGVLSGLPGGLAHRKEDGGRMTRMPSQQAEAVQEQGLADCIRCLTSSEYLEDSIRYVLEIIQQYYQSDRVYIIEADEASGTSSNTYEVCAEGVSPKMDFLQNIPIAAISFWMKQFAANGYIRIDDIEKLGNDREAEYEILKAQGVKSLMALPLYKEGEVKGFLGIGNPKANRDSFYYLEKLSYFVGSEITKNAMQKSLKKLSYEDSLTGLENRNSYRLYCDDFSKRHPVPVGVVFMDINGLKKLNEARGHVYGDMVIAHVADVMKQFFPGGRKFRLSGDEFLIVMESLAYDKFKEQLSLLEGELSSHDHSVLSIGTTWSDVGAELDVLVNKADRMMHISKQEYYKGYEEVASEKIPLLKELTDSILNRQFLIYLQPKLNMKTHRVDCAEVLVRFREKDGSISSPVKFIPLLESEGLISNIDFFVMEEVCRLLTKWKDTDFRDFQLSINFSRITMFDKNFSHEFWKVFRNYDLKPEQLELEITETQETLNKNQMAVLLDELKSHRFNIALDDFGVEYSSYEFLMMTDFDLLKIDKGITQRYEESDHGKTLVRHIVDMGHSIGVQCCAEGVETWDQLDYMQEIGCDYVQGYLIDKPIPVGQFEKKYMDAFRDEGWWETFKSRGDPGLKGDPV